MKDILIVHFNTPELTEACIKSILKHTEDCRITVFDNSTLRPLQHIDGIRIIDNTKGQEINFDALIKSFPNRAESTNDYGSAKHCYTIDYCFKYFKDGFLLLDSDVLIKKDISEFFDNNVIWVGQPHLSKRHPVGVKRLYPFCCYINVAMCNKYGIRYFDRNHMWQLSSGKGKWYDTGAWFLEATKVFPTKRVQIADYIVHYGGGSFKKDKKENIDSWLNINSEYYK